MINSRSSLPILKCRTFLAGTSTISPVLGLRALRGPLSLRRKLPKPRISTLSPLLRASIMHWKNASTTNSVWVLVNPGDFSITTSTSSDLVI
ncbi:hypothetical protein MBAV_000360 [Candidatus Magnetobacterium bavaricum]|uniref:Uncharacterized protein n=1 Tax=Candidatus Magnetobacterium bavaricum TaxID=29290 RepID=A0A0F3GZW2_9BACT|nr:hypothetical protein MBAV_000360 [Candidatus Magnetobacterium bavaricum]